MAVSAYLYGNAIKAAFNKEIDWDTDTIKIALVNNTYTPNQDGDAYWTTVVSHEVTGTGYTTNGTTLTTPTSTYTGATNKLVLDADDVTWSASTITARYAVIYDRTPSTDATRPLIGYIDFGADQSSSSGNFTITFNSGGIIEVTVS